MMINAIMNGKWEDLTQEIEPHSIDLICTDPPYGSTPTKWDKRPIWDVFMESMANVSKDTGQMWCFVRMPWAMDVYSSAITNGWVFVQEVIWEKQNAGGCTVKTFRKVHENIWHFKRPKAKTFNLSDIRTPKTTKGNKSVKRRGNSDTQFIGTDKSEYIDDGFRMPKSVIKCRNVHRTSEALGHPTQKPIELMIPLIKYSSNLGDLVLDPFSGTGTTLKAAKNLGRNWIGIEDDPEWYAKSVKRMEDCSS